jgi:hypothetical protein
MQTCVYVHTDVQSYVITCTHSVYVCVYTRQIKQALIQPAVSLTKTSLCRLVVISRVFFFLLDNHSVNGLRNGRMGGFAKVDNRFGYEKWT